MTASRGLQVVRAASAALVILAMVVQAIVLAQAGRFDPTRFFAFFTIQSNLIGVAAFAWLVANGIGRGRRASSCSAGRRRST